ncbi:21430_t:CDS:1, partial [Gigaspora rosea]
NIPLTIPKTLVDNPKSIVTIYDYSILLRLNSEKPIPCDTMKKSTG